MGLLSTILGFRKGMCLPQSGLLSINQSAFWSVLVSVGQCHGQGEETEDSLPHYSWSTLHSPLKGLTYFLCPQSTHLRTLRFYEEVILGISSELYSWVAWVYLLSYAIINTSIRTCPLSGTPPPHKAWQLLNLFSFSWTEYVTWRLSHDYKCGT